MANDSEVIRTLAWSALLFLFYRSLSACSILFISINATVFVGSSIQVASRSESAPITTRKRASKPDPNGCDGRAVAVSGRRSNINVTPKAPKPDQQVKTPPSNPSPTSLPFDDDHFSLSPKQQHNPNYGTIMKMYEDIIASDAETMQVQQETIQSQQDIIRSQREMIQRLQQLVGAQDAWIEEHLGEPSG